MQNQVNESDQPTEFSTSADGYPFIQELPLGWYEMCSSELPALAKIWTTRQKQISKSNLVEDFQTKLRRTWAIEAGTIEGLYSIERGITETLIKSGFQASLNSICKRATKRPRTRYRLPARP